MRPEERDGALLWDMHQHAPQTRALVADRSFAEFQSDRVLRLAVERAVQIIGEAAGGVSRQFQEAHSEIEWRRIVGLRNVLVHQYREIRDDELWLIVTERVPELIRLLEPLLPPDDSG